jgi:hypothetical protein
VPVATTVHDLQVVASVPRDPTDQPLSVIATPTHAIRIKRPSAAPTGVDWTRLTAEDLEEMPILGKLKRMTLGRDDEGVFQHASGTPTPNVKEGIGIACRIGGRTGSRSAPIGTPHPRRFGSAPRRDHEPDGGPASRRRRIKCIDWGRITGALNSSRRDGMAS